MRFLVINCAVFLYLVGDSGGLSKEAFRGSGLRGSLPNTTDEDDGYAVS